MKNNIAICPGSFRPFTNGHLHVVKESASIFDEIIVLISVNKNKMNLYNVDKMKIAIFDCIKREGIENVFVECFYGMTGDFCLMKGAKYIVRGIRNSQDFIYEENIAKVNKILYPDIETVYIRAKDEIVSSSMVREMISFGKDISVYVPKEILEVIYGDTNE